MTVIDFRFRPNTPETVAGIASSEMFKELCEKINFSEMKGQTLAEIIQDLDRHDVRKAVITGRDCETTYQAKSNNASVVDFTSKYPEKFIGFAGVDPHKGMAGIRELTGLINEKGLKGAAVDPYLSKIYVHDAKYYPIYAKCCELDIPLIITTGPATLVPKAVIDHVAPRYIDFVARDFPELKIIISHGGYPWVSETIAVVQRNKNVYVELSEYEFYPHSEAYIQAVNTIISDKVLYASAHPFVDFKKALKSYQELPFEEGVREQVMYKNAASILGLEVTTPKSHISSASGNVAPASGNNMEQQIIEGVMKELAKRGMVGMG